MRDRCQACFGRGWLPNNSLSEPYREETCPVCSGSGEQVRLPYDKARSSRVRIDNVSIKGHEAFTVLDADGRIVAHTARKGKE